MDVPVAPAGSGHNHVVVPENPFSLVSLCRLLSSAGGGGVLGAHLVGTVAGVAGALLGSALALGCKRWRPRPGA